MHEVGSTLRWAASVKSTLSALFVGRAGVGGKVEALLLTPLPHNDQSTGSVWLFTNDLSCHRANIAAWLKMAKIWKQLKYLSKNGRLQTMWNTRNEILVNLKNEENAAICGHVGRPGGRYAKWGKPGRKRQILPGITHMGNLRESQTHRNSIKVVTRGWGWWS